MYENESRQRDSPIKFALGHSVGAKLGVIQRDVERVYTWLSTDGIRTVKDVRTLLENLKQILRSPGAAKLPDETYDWLITMENQAKYQCEKGDTDQARAIFVRVKEIVDQGPPTGETGHGFDRTKLR